jgi:D-amino-acid dehydrogenase
VGREACVVGAGVVGITTAWALVESGWRVRLLERRGIVAGGASARNGGQLSYRYLSPFADAGVPMKALRWLVQADAPLRLAPFARPSPLPWLAAFLARCTRAANRDTVARLAPLGEYSRRCLDVLRADADLPPFGWRRAGKLVVHRDAETLARAAAAIDPASGQRRLSRDECVALEPSLTTLAPHLQGGIFDADEAVADCQAFCEALFARLRAHPRFDGLHEAEALALERLDAGTSPRLVRVAVRTGTGRHEADAVVLAAGTGSRALMRACGHTLPLYPLKGYSLTLPIDPARHVPPQVSVTDLERKVLYARIGDQVRVAAMVDLVGEDDAVEPRRLESLLRIARTDMPDAGDYDHVEPWAGLRPATPDGAPRIGPGPWPGLWLNVGHGGLGFTLACGSAGLLAARLGGVPAGWPVPDFDGFLP